MSFQLQVSIPVLAPMSGIHYPRCPECGGSMDRFEMEHGNGPWVCMEPECGWSEAKDDGEVVWIAASVLRR